MSFKRYIKINGKVYGPYEYSSHRTKDGSVKSIYHGKIERKSRRKRKKLYFQRPDKIIPLILVFLILFVSIMFLFTTDFEKRITGLFVAPQYEERDYVDTIGLTTSTSQEYQWIPEHQGQLLAVKLNGQVTGSGTTSIWLEDKLIFSGNINQDTPLDAVCIDTCRALNLNQEGYMIRIELENTSIELSSLNYEILERIEVPPVTPITPQAGAHALDLEDQRIEKEYTESVGEKKAFSIKKSPENTPELFYLYNTETEEYDLPYVFIDNSKGNNLEYHVLIRNTEQPYYYSDYVFTKQGTELYASPGSKPIKSNFIVESLDSSDNSWKKLQLEEPVIEYVEKNNHVAVNLSYQCKQEACKLTETYKIGFDGQLYINEVEAYFESENNIEHRILWNLEGLEGITQDELDVKESKLFATAETEAGTEEEKPEPVKRKFYDKVKVDFSDFEGETRLTEFVGEKKAQVYFFEQGEQGNLVVDPVLSASETSTTVTVSVGDGTDNDDFMIVLDENVGCTIDEWYDVDDASSPSGWSVELTSGGAYTYQGLVQFNIAGGATSDMVDTADNAGDNVLTILENTSTRVIVQAFTHLEDWGGGTHDSNWQLTTYYTIYPTGQIYGKRIIARINSNAAIGTWYYPLRIYTDNSGSWTRADQSRDPITATQAADAMDDFCMIYGTNGGSDEHFGDVLLALYADWARSNQMQTSTSSGSDYYRLGWQDTNSFTFNAGTNETWHFMLQLKPNTMNSNTAAAPYVSSYRNPGNITVANGTLITSDSGDDDFDGFNEVEGCYVVNATGNYAKFDLNGSTYNKYNPVFKIKNYTAGGDPYVILESSVLTNETDFNADVNTSSDVLIVQYLGNITSNEQTFEIQPGPPEDNNDPEVRLIEPVNRTNQTSTSVTFNCSAQDTGGPSAGLRNITLYGSWTAWHANETQNLTGAQVWNSTTFTKTITDGDNYVWNCLACDESDNCAFNNTNFTFSIDSNAPSVSNTNANETSIIQAQYFCLNATVTDAEGHLSIVFANVWNTTAFHNYTMTESGGTCSGTASDNIYGVQVLGTHAGIWNYTRVYANDTFGNLQTYDTGNITIDVSATSPDPPNDPSPVLASVDGSNTTDSDLNCSSVISDPNLDLLNVTVKWYLDDVLNLTVDYNNSYTSYISFSAYLESGNLSVGDSWNCSMRLNSGTDYSNWVNSSSITIASPVPTHDNPLLTSSAGLNRTNENLTCYNQSTSDYDNDAVTNIYHWYVNNVSFGNFIMPLDTNVSSTTSKAVKDYSGHHNNGTLGNGTAANAPRWINEGVIGGAYEFDGNDRIEITDSASLDGNDDWYELTIELWVNLSTSQTGRRILAKRIPGSGNDKSYQVGTQSATANELYCGFYTGDGSNYGEPTAGYASPTNEWIYVVCTYRDGLGKLYINGDFVDDDTSVSGNIHNSGPPLSLGSFDDATAGFEGTLDEVRIYNYTLNDEQIQRRYLETKDGFTINSTIVANETTTDEVWQCGVTPNDATYDGLPKNSSSLTVLSLTTDISSCQDLAADTHYVLTADVDANNYCFNITGNNIVLDCQGHLINYSRTGTGAGINNSGSSGSTGYNNITIKNCIINQTGNYQNSHGIYSRWSDNMTIYNNTMNPIYASCHGISSYYSQGYNFTNNTIRIRSSSSRGIDIYNCDNGTMRSNKINVSGIYGNGIEIDSSFNSTLRYNQIYMEGGENSIFVVATSRTDHNHSIDETNLAEDKPINYTKNAIGQVFNGSIDSSWNNKGEIICAACEGTTYADISMSAGTGIAFYNATTSEIIRSNINSKGCGIYFYRVTLSNVTNTNVTISSAENSMGVVLTSSVTGTNLISQSRINTSNTCSSQCRGIYLGYAGPNNTINNNIIDTYAYYGEGIRFTNEKSIVTNNTITTRGYAATGWYFYNGANNTIKDNVINASGGSASDIYIYSAVGANAINNITNCTFNQSDVSFHSSSLGGIRAQWYIDASMNYSDNSPVTTGTVYARNNTNALAMQETTNSQGRITRQILTEYYQNRTSKFFETNFTINGTDGTYWTNETIELNLTTNYIDSSKIQLWIDVAAAEFNIASHDPVNDTWSNGTLNVSFRVSGAGETYNASLYLASGLGSDFRINGSKIVANNTLGVITPISSLADDNYRWYVNATNGTTINTSEIRTLHVDTVIPFINFTSPTPANGSTIGNDWIYINTTVSDDRTPQNISAFIDFNRTLAGWWRIEYDDNNISNIFDSSENGHNGTLHMNTGLENNTYSGWTSSGKWGKALRFDGVDDYAEIPDFGPFNFTVEAWAWRDPQHSDSASYVGIVNKWTPGLGPEDEWFIGVHNGMYSYWLKTVDSYQGMDTAVSFPKGRWTHIAMTYDGSTFKGYADGEEIASQDITGTVNNGTTRIQLGTNNFAAGQWFNGSIDEIRIWKRVLSPQEINASYNAGVYGLYRNFTNLSLGTYGVKAYVLDSAGNVNMTENRSITYSIIETNFTVSSFDPVNDTWSNGTLNFSFKVVGGADSYDAYLYLASGLGSDFQGNGSASVSNDTISTITPTSALDDDNYRWYISATYISTTNTSEIRTLHVDKIKPFINFTSPTPENDSTVTVGSIYVNTTVNDDRTPQNISAFIDFNKSLVLWYRFEYDAENVSNAYDSSTYGNNGTLINLNKGLDNGSNGWTSSGRYGKAIKINRTGYIISPNSSSLEIGTGSFTRELWLYANALGSEVADRMLISGKQFYQDGPDVNFRYLEWSAIEAEILDSSDNLVTLSANIAGQQKKWIHLAVVGDRSDNTTRLYVNGVLRDSDVLTAIGNIGAHPLYFGQSGEGYDLNGSIDEVRLWNRALSAQEINASYNAGIYRLERNFAGLGTGNYSYRAYVIDQAGNLNMTENRTVSVEPATEISSCQNLAADTGYILTSNVAAATTCFNITGDDIELDCSGYTINYSSTGTGYAINNTGGFDGVTIKNCIINQSVYQGSSHAIYFRNTAENGIIYNNTIYTIRNSGIYLDTGTNYVNVSNNVLVLSSHAIHIANSESATLRNNRHNATSDRPGTASFVRVFGADSSSFDHVIDETNLVEGKPVNYTDNTGNTVYNGSVDSTWDDKGQIICAGCNNVTYTEMDIIEAQGISFYYTYNSTIQYFNITSSKGKGIYFFYHGSNNTVQHNRINLTGDMNNGIEIYSYSQSNKIVNNSVFTYGSPTQSVGLRINSNSGYNTISNCTFRGTYGTYPETNNGQYFFDTVLDGTSQDIRIYDDQYINLTNCSFDTVGFISPSQGIINVHWYLDAAMNYTNNSAVIGGDVIGYNVNNTLMFNETTSSNSLIARQALLEYWQNSTGQRFKTNYTINGTDSSSWSTTTEQVNLTTNYIDSSKVQLFVDSAQQISSCQDLSEGDYILTSNVVADTTCFNITGGNIILDCGGYTINYSSTGTGMGVNNSNGYHYLTVKNCIINSSSTSWGSWGIYLNRRANFTTLYNNTFNDYTGIFVDSLAADFLNASYNYFMYSGTGIQTTNSRNTTLRNNRMNATSAGGSSFVIVGTGGLNDDIDESNLFEGRPINYTYNATNQVFDGSVDSTWNDKGQIICARCNNVTYTGISNDGLGISFYRTANSTIQYCNITSSKGSNGIYLRWLSNNNTIQYNSINISSSNGNAVQIYSSSQSNNLTNNTLAAYGLTGGYGYRSWASADFNTIYDSNIIGNYGTYPEIGIWTAFYNCRIEGQNQYDMVLYGDGYANITNCSLLGNNGVNIGSENAALNVHWYLDAAMNYTNNSAVIGGDVIGYNVNNTLIFNETTNSNSLIARQTLLEYMQNATQKYFKTNYTVNGTDSSSWSTTTEQVNLTTNYIDSSKVQLLITGIGVEFYTTAYDPVNDTWSNGTLNMSFIVSGSADTYNASLYLASALGSDFRINGSRIVANNTLDVITPVSSLADDNYRWYVNATNGTVTNLSEIRTLHVDTVIPFINFTSPTPNNDSATSNDWIYVNTTLNDDRTAQNVSALIDFNSSLVAWYRFEYDSENVSNAYDSSGQGNNGTMINMNTGLDNSTRNGWTSSGYRGKAMKFDGINDYINASNGTAIHGFNPDEGTYELWMKPNWNGSNTENYVMISECVQHDVNEIELYYRGGTYYEIRLDISGGDGTTEYQGAQIANWEIGDWVHLVATWSESAQEKRIYINGHLEDSRAHTVDVNDTGDHLRIGQIVYYFGNGWFNGTMDEVKVHARALSPEEVNASYNAGIYRLYHNFTNLSVGTYGVKAYVVDAAGNVNMTENRSITVSTLTEISSCQDLAGNTNYSLTANVQADRTCFNITGDNIELDCKGRIINYSTSAVGYAINATGNYDNITIKNCIINNASSAYAQSHAIYFRGVNTNRARGNLIENNTIRVSASSTRGIYFSYYVVFTNITGNNITTSGSSDNGIYFEYQSMNNSIRNNSITITAASNYGIYFYSSPMGHVIDNNNITIYASSGYGIYLHTNCDANNITNNNITATAVGTNVYGIYVHWLSDYVYVENNSIRTGLVPGYISASNNVKFINNNFSAFGPSSNNYGIQITGNAANNEIHNNTIETSGTNAYGIYLLGTTCEENIIFGNDITTTGSNAKGVYFSSTQHNTLKRNNITTSQGMGFDILDTSTVPDYYNHSIDTTNTVNVRPIYYYAREASPVNLQDVSNISHLYIVQTNHSFVRNITATGEAVIIQSDNVTITGSNITSANFPDNHGILINSYADSNNITGNEIYVKNNSQGVEIISYSDKNLVFNNNITSSANGGGIYVYNRAFNNNITSNNITSANIFAIYLYAVINSTTINNNSITTTDSSTHAIYLATNCGENLFDNNNVTALGSGSYAFSIYSGCRRNNITNSIVGSSSSYAVYTQTNCDELTLINNTFSGATCLYLLGGRANYGRDNNLTCSGTGLYIGTDNNNFTGMNITIPSGGSSFHGINLNTGTTNYIENSTINNAAGFNSYGIYSYHANASIKNTYINSVSYSDIYLVGGGRGRLNLTNCTFDKADVSFGASALQEMNVHWYLDAAMNYTNNSVIVGGDVIGYNVNNTLIFNETTNSNSLIARQTLLEYMQNATQKYFKTNYTINGTDSSSWSTTTEQVNLTTNYIDSSKVQLWIDVAAAEFITTSYDPVNDTWSNGTLNFSFRVIGIYDTYNASLYLASALGSDFRINGSRIVANNTLDVITPVSSLADDNYRWYVNATNGTGTNLSEIRTLHVDKIKPSISFENPTPGNNSKQKNYSSLYVNVTVSDDRTPQNISALIDFNSSLVAWYRFEYDSENVSNVYDTSGHGNDGTLNMSMNTGLENNTYSGWTSSGYRGKAMKFDGVDDYVNCGNDSSLNITKSITIETLIKPAMSHEATGNNMGVVAKALDPGWSWQLRFGNDEDNDRLGFQFNQDGAVPGVWVNIDENLTTGQWYHVVGTYNGTHAIIYLNGVMKETNALSQIQGSSAPLIIGNEGWPNNFFNGTIDEVKIWNRALSPEEINASYNAGIYRLERNFTNLSSGTYGYRAYVVDAAGNLNMTENRTLRINYPANAPTLTYPATDTHTTNRTERFEWLTATDPDSDSPLNYTFNLTCWPAGCVPDDNYYATNVVNNYTSLSEQNKMRNFWDDNEWYKWEIRVWDGYDYSAPANFTLYLDSLIALNMLNDTIEFGAMNVSQSKNTSTNVPWPFSFYNDGNCYLNVSINSTDLWKTETNPSDYYQFKADYLAEEYGSFIYANSTTDWTQMPITSMAFIDFFNYTNTNDTAETDMLVTVPALETAGYRYSNVTFIGTYIEEGTYG